MVENAEAEDSELGLGFDPIFNAQDYPEEGFSVVSSDKLGFIILQGKKWKKFKLKMRLVKVEGKWKVDGCGAVNIRRETLINHDGD